MGGVTPLVVVGVAVLGLGELLHIIGLGTPNWVEAKHSEAHAGLFKICGRTNCIDYTHTDSNLEATQAMTIIGMLCGLVALGSAIVFVAFKIIGKSMPSFFLAVCAAAGVAACIFITIGVIVFGTEVFGEEVYHDSLYDLGFSFGLCTAGGVLMAIGGIVIYIGGRSSADF